MSAATDDDLVFRALADRSRRRMLDILQARSGATVGELAEEFDMSRIGAMKHLKVLEDADLVRSQKDGRTRRLYLNPVPIQRIHERWTTQFSALFAGGLLALKRELEQKGSKK